VSDECSPVADSSPAIRVAQLRSWRKSIFGAHYHPVWIGERNARKPICARFLMIEEVTTYIRSRLALLAEIRVSKGAQVTKIRCSGKPWRDGRRLRTMCQIPRLRGSTFFTSQKDGARAFGVSEESGDVTPSTANVRVGSMLSKKDLRNGLNDDSC